MVVGQTASARMELLSGSRLKTGYPNNASLPVNRTILNSTCSSSALTVRFMSPRNLTTDLGPTALETMAYLSLSRRPPSCHPKRALRRRSRTQPSWTSFLLGMMGLLTLLRNLTMGRGQMEWVQMANPFGSRPLTQYQFRHVWVLQDRTIPNSIF